MDCYMAFRNSRTDSSVIEQMPEPLMVTGLAASAILNVAFGFSSTVFVLGAIWMLNGWFQGMGFPPCARLITHWFSPKQLATKMSIWNISHPIGGAVILILCGYLVVFG